MTLPDARAPVAYLDSSALIKLIVVEAKSGALRRELAQWPRRTSSPVAHIEVTRAATRLGASASRSPHELSHTVTCSQVDPIAPDARRVGGMLLRSLDAVNDHGKSPVSIMEIPHPGEARLAELVHVRASGLLCCPADRGERVG